MKNNMKKNPTPQSIKEAIKSEFAFLVDSYGFSEVVVMPQSDDIYSEVHFEKKNWKIAILTTAYGAKVSLQLISPDGIRGFLSHILEPEIGKPSKIKYDGNVFDDIKSNSQCLQKYGSTLLKGETIDFERVLETITNKQQQWAMNAGILTKA